MIIHKITFIKDGHHCNMNSDYLALSSKICEQDEIIEANIKSFPPHCYVASFEKNIEQLPQEEIDKVRMQLLPIIL